MPVALQKKNKGFSLVEIMVVMVLIAIIVTMASQRYGKNNRQLKKDIHNFATLMREIRTKARLKNQTYRMVFNLPGKDSEPQTYWIESTSQKYLVQRDEKALKDQLALEDENRKKELADPNGFDIDPQLSKEGPKALPKGLFFESIEVAALNKEFTAGRIYIHYFPEGRVEEAAVHITNKEKLNWTITVHPLTGRVDLIPKKIKLKELQEGQQ